jgi:hypothetical protein
VSDPEEYARYNRDGLGMWSTRYDPEAGELRMVFSQLDHGEHDHREWRVLSEGRRVRHPNPAIVGCRVREVVDRPYVMVGVGTPVFLTTEAEPVLVERVPCPRTTNRRERCPHCRRETGEG